MNSGLEVFNPTFGDIIFGQKRMQSTTGIYWNHRYVDIYVFPWLILMILWAFASFHEKKKIYNQSFYSPNFGKNKNIKTTTNGWIKYS